MAVAPPLPFPQVPNLFAADEYEQVIAQVRPLAKEQGIPEGDRDAIFAHFISLVQDKLHIVLCMSPVGDSFRARCRMFPSLVNCCTIDWFIEWPRLVAPGIAQDTHEYVTCTTCIRMYIHKFLHAYIHTFVCVQCVHTHSL